MRTILRGVTIVDTRDGRLDRNLDVALGPDRILEIRPEGSLGEGSVADIVDARGKYLVPGFLDMHTHVLNAGRNAVTAVELMLAHGITGFREMGSTPALLRQRAEGSLPLPADGPRLLALAGPVLLPFNAGTPEAAVRAVNEHHDLGADFIKVAFAPRPAFMAALAEAARVGLPYAGHLPAGIDPRAASGGGMRSIEHLGPGAAILSACSSDEESIRDAINANPRRLPPIPPFKIPFLDGLIRRRMRKFLMNPSLHYGPGELEALRRGVETFDDDRAVALAGRMAADGTWQCVTLIRDCTCMCSSEPRFHEDPNLRLVAATTVEEWRELDVKYRALPAETQKLLADTYALYLRMTGLFDREGVRIITGSDAGGIWDIPGPSLHQEFDELARAGLAPLRVLQAATLNGAEFLGKLDSMGTVEAGKASDVVLLDGDPTASVDALHLVAGVHRGRWWGAADLEGLVGKVAREKVQPLI